MNSDDILKLENQICFPLYAGSRLITKAYKPLLDELGITYPQYLVLLVLWEKDNISIKQISSKLILETNTLTPLLKRMENSGLITRSRSEEDERTVYIKLSSKGKKLKERAQSIPSKLIEQLSSEDISVSEILQMKETLCLLIDKINEK
ncbi:MarR family winged helix-turn-helix transcriptional regulator [Mangrovivirga cuniculi]|uniref:MarR family transcriptional regulator n=1 Tax=Mangrovivirga cuniculi TaxID=2715131 RepID=A0A4D7K150_9BACT|nr:MarR family transcriptional regulator [Mangrovivirga cuniculi]QCK14594.1 MarR family transcriptional regulator [Mangrovivirga cuniculi]